MTYRHARTVLPAALSLLVFLLVACGSDDDPTDPPVDWPPAGDALVVDNTTVALFGAIDTADFAAVRDAHRIYYGHTSHGSQLVTGMQMLAAEDAACAPPTFHEVADDLGAAGDTTWVAPTSAYLNDHPGEYDVVMWSWCGGVSDNTPEGIDTYLQAMAGLEAEFPAVTFVYMTGHLDGTGAGGNLRARNDQIRAWCRAHGKILFDFAAIERFDPAGTEYPDGSDACEWCADWCSTNDCADCGSCAHSHCFNCYRKGQALWCLLAALPR